MYSNSPRQDVVIVAGDMNAKIGEGAPIGKHALGERNENGDKLIEFAQLNELAACNAQCTGATAPKAKIHMEIAGRSLPAVTRLTTY